MAIGTAATIGVGVSAISSGLSFKQAADQSRMASKARKASEKLVADARQKAEKDYYEGLNVPLDAYGEQFAQNMANQQQTIQALQEGDTRNLIGGVQGLTAAAAAANEQTRIGLGQELYANRKMKADSRQNINQQLLQMDIGQATDQQLMARDAEQARAAAMKSGISSAANAAYIYGRGKKLYGNKDKTSPDSPDVDPVTLFDEFNQSGVQEDEFAKIGANIFEENPMSSIYGMTIPGGTEQRDSYITGLIPYLTSRKKIVAARK